MKQMAQVIEFNRDILGIQPRPVGSLPEKEAKHLVKCLREEATEFEQAYQAGDFIKQIDSLVDSMYFSLGGLYKMGLSPEVVTLIFTAVHEANMTKKKGVVASRSTGAPDAIKPEGWVPPEERIAQVLDQFTEEA